MPLSNTGTDRFLAQNYYSKSQLNSGQLDTRYFAESEHINSSAGAGDAGKPIKLNASGKIDATMITDSDIDHGSTGGLSDDDHTQYALLAGRSGGQTIIGGTASGNNLTLQSTSNATRGMVVASDAMRFVGPVTSSAVGVDNVRIGIEGGTPRIYLENAGIGQWGIDVDGSDNLRFFIPGNDRIIIDLSGNMSTTGTFAAAGAITQGGVAVVTTTGSQTLTNKTLTAPVIATISNTGTLTLPTSTDTLVGRATTDTLTNKTLTTPTISATGFANANHAHQGSTSGGQLDHGLALTGLTDDDHTQYALLAGRSGGQSLTGGTAANDDITIQGTSNATRTTSYVILQPTGGNVAVGGTTTDWKMEVAEGNFRIAFNPGFGSATNYISSYNSAVGVQTAAPLSLFGSRVSIDSGIFNINTGNAPASAAASGTAGDFAWDTSFLYVCTGTNQWRRISHATW